MKEIPALEEPALKKPHIINYFFTQSIGMKSMHKNLFLHYKHFFHYSFIFNFSAPVLFVFHGNSRRTQSVTGKKTKTIGKKIILHNENFKKSSILYQKLQRARILIKLLFAYILVALDIFLN